jgi:hypothetical protein
MAVAPRRRIRSAKLAAMTLTLGSLSACTLLATFGERPGEIIVIERDDAAAVDAKTIDAFTNGVPDALIDHANPISVDAALDTNVTEAPPVDAGADVAVDANPPPLSLYATTVLADSPIAYWRVGDKTGTVHATEFVDGGLTASYNPNGGVTYGVIGAIKNDPDTAITLDGVTGNLSVAETTALSFPDNATFSVEMWMRPKIIDGLYRRPWSRETSDPRTGYSLYFVTYGDGGAHAKLCYENWIETGGVATNNRTQCGSAEPQVGVYTHVVFTYDGSIAKMYMNGGEADNGAQTAAAQAGIPPFLWGTSARDSTYDGPYSGDLDELAIYNYALTPAQVTKHYNIGSTGSP